MTSKNFAKYHLFEALLSGIAQADGSEVLARRLRARLKWRLINMSEEELWELAKLTASHPDRPVELVYQEDKRAIEEIRATASEWINDFQTTKASNREEGIPDRVLVIESESSLSKQLASTLGEAGFSVALVPDCPEALLKLDEFRPDIIILDEALPGGDGIDACSRLRSTFCVPVHPAW